MKGQDVRAVANLVLDEGDKLAKPITNLHLNKILYFMHVDCLRDRGHPLISAKIEAWKNGPVFREVYNQFKGFGRSSISTRAQKVDYETGNRIEAKLDVEHEFEEYMKASARFFAEVPSHVLVDLSHVKGGAWDKAWNHEGDYNIGMEITDSMIHEFELTRPKRIRLL